MTEKEIQKIRAIVEDHGCLPKGTSLRLLDEIEILRKLLDLLSDESEDGCPSYGAKVSIKKRMKNE